MVRHLPILIFIAALAPAQQAQHARAVVPSFKLEEWVGKPIGDVASAMNAPLTGSDPRHTAETMWAFGAGLGLRVGNVDIGLGSAPGQRRYKSRPPTLTDEQCQAVFGNLPIVTVYLDSTSRSYRTNYGGLLSAVGLSTKGAKVKKTYDGPLEGGGRSVDYRITNIAGLPAGSSATYSGYVDGNARTHCSLRIKIPANPALLTPLEYPSQ